MTDEQMLVIYFLVITISLIAAIAWFESRNWRKGK